MINSDVSDLFPILVITLFLYILIPMLLVCICEYSSNHILATYRILLQIRNSVDMSHGGVIMRCL